MCNDLAFLKREHFGLSRRNHEFAYQGNGYMTTVFILALWYILFTMRIDEIMYVNFGSLVC